MVYQVKNMPQAQTPATATNAPVDLREYHPLGRLRGYIRGYVFCEGLLMALICVCLWFWFTFTLDFSLQYFFEVDLLDHARAVRWVLAGGFAALLVFFLVWYIVRRIFRDFRSDALALILEKRFPKLLGDRLITAVELANLKKAASLGYSVDMIKKTMLDARERVNQVPVNQAFNWGRLFLTAWLLVGVSILALAAAFPIAVLFSLTSAQVGSDLWRALVVNLLAVVGVVLLFFSPFLLIKYWRRSSAARGFALATCAIALVFSIAGYAVSMSDKKHLTHNEYTWRLYHGVDISMSRDLAFAETRWPKDEYFVEWLDFPVDEKRIEQNKQIMTRAYFTRFIIAGDKPGTWRPLEWRDLKNKELAIANLPPLPMDGIKSYMFRLTEGDPESPVGFNAAAIDYPTENGIKVDFAIAAVLDEDLGGFTAEDRAAFKKLEIQIEERAADLKLGGRLIRQIAPPEEVKVCYREVKSRNDTGQNANIMKQTLRALDPGRKNVYALEQKLKFVNPVILHIEATVNKKTVRSGERFVDMVLPPRIDLLEYQEFRPAYYYHLPPAKVGADTVDERRNLLKGLLQPMPIFRWSQPPEMVDVKIFNGSAVRVQAVADKPLREVQAYYREFTPELGNKPNESRVPLRVGKDGRTFDLVFTNKGKPIEDWSTQWWAASMPVQPSWALRPNASDYQPTLASVTKPMTLELVMTDTDNMTSSRSITIKPEADGVPNVTLFVSTIRKIEEQSTRRSYYLCTARAEIPFAKESYVVDDHGIHKVEFAYEYLPLADSTETTFRAGLAAWLWASSPVQPSIGDFLYRREVLLRTVGSAKRRDPITGVAAIDNFASEQRKANQERPPLSVAQLEELLKAPLVDQTESPILKRFDFWNKDEDRPITFDIDRRLPDLQKKHPITNEQTSYELTLDVRATDSNVQSSTARVGTFKDGALTFRIVPHDVLQVYIAREERDQGDKLDDVIKKLDIQLANLRDMASRLPNLSVETTISEQTRVENILDTVSKQNEAVVSIAEAFGRLIEEYKINRFSKDMTTGLTDNVKIPLERTNAKEFPESVETLNTFLTALKGANSAVALPAHQPALAKLQTLIERLRFLRSAMGAELRFNEAVARIKRATENQAAIQQALRDLQDRYFKDLLFIQITPPSAVTVAAKGKLNVRFDFRMPNAINVLPPKVTLKIMEPNSGIQVPAEIDLSKFAAGERNFLEFDITAGETKGDFTLLIQPTQGPVVDVKVVVK
jgi:hypothetical protein